MARIKELKWDWILLVFLTVLLVFYYTRLVSTEYSGLLLMSASIIAALPVVFSAIKSLKNKKISVDLLASVALVASIVAKEWASAAFVNLMLTSARIFGDYTENKARATIRSLLKLRSQKVKIKHGKKFTEIPVSQVRVGDLIVIEAGDRIPIDGVVDEGEASIDQSSLTGESIPVFKKKGDSVFSATLNTSGTLMVKVEKTGKDTTLEKIIDLVENSQKNKSEIRTTADVFANWYIIITLLASFLIFAIFRDLNLLLSLLLVACADDIAVAVPLAFLSAIGYAAKRGVIIKGANYLEGLTAVKTLILDKTGTITRGKLKVQNVISFGKYSKKDVLKFASITEALSEHPVAKAIVEYAKNYGVKIEKISGYEEVPGNGVRTIYNKKALVFGKIDFLKKSGIKIPKDTLEKIDKQKNEGFNITAISYGKDFVGAIALADEIRPNMRELILRLRNLGVKKFIMLTGDNEKVAQRVSNEVGIATYYANLLPQDKINYIKKYLNNNGKLAMVGDGVNDAAGLALADVGIAMGAIGSDTAIEAADIALMKDDFSEIPEMVELGKYTTKIARQDFWIWGIVNIIGLALVFGRIIGPEGASAYNFITDFFPLINSLRLFNLHLKIK